MSLQLLEGGGGGGGDEEIHYLEGVDSVLLAVQLALQ